MNRPASNQTYRIDLERVEDGVLFLRDGQCLTVLEVSSLNFALMSDVEQEAIISGYAAALNSLTFPVQIVVRVLPTDVERYLEEVQRRARQDLPERLAEIARDHVLFLRRQARNRALLDRRFLLIVPADPAVAHSRRTWWPFGRRSSPSASAESARQQLSFRAAELLRQLSRCGLQARRLGDAELAQLYYSCLCPELSARQRLRDVTASTALVVTGERRKEAA